MRIRAHSVWFPLLVAVFARSVPALGQPPSVVVHESQIRAALDAGRLSVTIPVSAAARSGFTARLHADVLAPDDRVVSSGERDVSIAPGRRVVVLSVAAPESAGSLEDDRLLWHRLAYRLSAGSADEPIAKGTIALGGALGLFSLSAAYRGEVIPGQRYEVRVRAVNPITRKGVGGVTVRATLDLDEEHEAGLAVADATTGATGDALLRWLVPRSAWPGEGSLRIEARKGTQVRRQSIHIETLRGDRAVVSTDKLLYQPGQALHARALVVGHEKRATARARVQFTLHDPDNDVLLRTDAETNEFGIASVDWQLPETLRLGTYWLAVERRGSDGSGHLIGSGAIDVRRYDLATFTVTAAADRPYYLPGQSAEIDVAATYLFGKPVTRGSVRLVHEAQRRWDYHEQKWDTREEETLTAELDARGHAIVRVDLERAQSRFEPGVNNRFDDLTYAAYVTDATTGKTEQRRLPLRISRDPFHLYLSGTTLVGNLATFYVTACYPDGSPAEIDVQLGQITKEHTYRALRSVKTNRYGVAKVTDLQIDAAAIDDEGAMVALDARSKSGAAVHSEEWLWSPVDRTTISTDKALYRAGEPIKLSLRTALSGRVVVEALRNDAVVWSSGVQVRNASAFLVIPYEADFDGEITVVAYSLDEAKRDTYEWRRWAGHSVLYPHDSTLRVTVRPDRRSYSPGDPVVAPVRVNSVSGPERSALGIVVVDKAVEERARTDDEFGGHRAGFWDWSWWAEPGTVGGVSRRDLDGLDLSTQLPDGLDLAAEVLLNAWPRGRRPEVAGDDYAARTSLLFRPRMIGRLAAFESAVEHATTFPIDENALVDVLRRAGIEADALADPWGTPYIHRFDITGPDLVLEVASAGPDKAPGTADDIEILTLRRRYFEQTGAKMDAAARDFLARTGGCIQDEKVLARELLHQGVDVRSLRNPRGTPYSFAFTVDGTWCRVIVHTTRATHPRSFLWDGTPVWTTSIDYFADARKKLDEAAAGSARLPHDDDEMDRLLERAGLALRGMRDPWGSAFYVTYPSTHDYSQVFVYWSDRTGEQLTPVTRTLQWVKVWSPGRDRMPGTQDDVEVARVSQVVEEQNARDRAAQLKSEVALGGGTGAIEGVVKDANGGALPGVKIEIRAEDGTERHSGTTSADGRFLVRGISLGVYRIAATLQGFMPTTVLQVPVSAAAVTTVNITLQIGALTEFVMVSGEAVEVNTRTSATVKSARSERAGHTPARDTAISTPRLRDYFPETLYWAPSVVTDGSGAAKVSFRLADSITTWKMCVIASTVTGEIGTADTEIVAFQPFFVDHDPPKVLTVGDEIDLPVVVRSYLAEPQQVDVEMKSAEWFALRGAGRQKATVAAGEAQRIVFPMTAVASAAKGAQQVSATSRAAADRIEKSVYVHPDGEERSVTSTRLFRDSASIPIELPADRIGRSTRSTVKIYPNLLAHVMESMEAGMERPYGCAEQSISAAYPAVLLLKHDKAASMLPLAIRQRAERYAREGLERLLGYRTPSGGFSYWGRDDADVALTAYAVRFLVDLRDLPLAISVDDAVLEKAMAWLVTRQRPDGRWQSRDGGNEELAAYVTHVLAYTRTHAPIEKLNTNVGEAVRRGLRALESPREPYALALYALAQADAGDADAAGRAVARLREMAHREGSKAYWALETNSPFYGWGNTGRVEATAVVLKALTTIETRSGEQDELADGALMFLLSQKDKWGVWYSGQATVKVDDALLTAMRPAAGQGPSRVLVFVNGEPGPSLDIPAASVAAGPVFADISRLLKQGANTIELRRVGAASDATAQIVSTYFVPWPKRSDAREALLPGESRALRLAVDFDKRSAEVGEEVRCTVRVERIGHAGYGMMLAEVGLPPGADVDRASLERAIEAGGWDVARYEVQPDRVVFYVWPRAGGTTFTFLLRPRFAMKARTAASVLYDYYNPDATVVLPPVDFDVRAQPGSRTTSRSRPAVAGSALCACARATSR